MAEESGIAMTHNELDRTNARDSYLEEAVELVRSAKAAAARSVNLALVYANFELGRIIVEEEQEGDGRAAYGKHVLEELSARLTLEFGKGYSVENLTRARKFFLVYGDDEISSTALTKFGEVPTTSTGRRFYLSWSHYLKLMRMDDADRRHFYEIEAVRESWSLSELQRQCDSGLYERLALSRKGEVERLVEEGISVEKPTDAIKDPYILEFLDLDERSGYTETELETLILDHLQEFLLELGKGFLFSDRQKRFTYEEDHFKVDLVFYNRVEEFGPFFGARNKAKVPYHEQRRLTAASIRAFDADLRHGELPHRTR